jgi:predicted transcriptional regulator
MSNKEVVIEAVRQLPETYSFEEISEQIALLAAIRKGEEAADAGRVLPHEDVKRDFAQWISK